jgi:hypothetical protein
VIGVQPHLLPVIGRQRPRLLPDPNRNRDPPYVVNECGASDRREVGFVSTPGLGCRRCLLGNSPRVTDQVRGGKVGEVAHSRQRPIDRLALKRQLRCWLAREHLIPGGRLLLNGQDLGCPIRKTLGDTGIERSPRPRSNGTGGSLTSAKYPLERRVAGDVNDPHREWDLIASGPPRLAMPVPTLGAVSEQRANSRWKA